MHHGFDLVLLKDFTHAIVVADIALFKGKALTKNRFQAVKHRGIAIAEVIKDHHIVAGLSHFNGGMRADKTGTARQ